MSNDFLINFDIDEGDFPAENKRVRILSSYSNDGDRNINPSTVIGSNDNVTKDAIKAF